jgi:aspartyl aminopeptidase
MGESRPGIASLQEWLDASPTPFHVVESARQVLIQGGFVEQLSLSDELSPKGFLAVDGAIVAWSLAGPRAPFRIIGAHTDSPNLRIQPNPDMVSNGWAQLGIEIYGGVLLNSWLDRDLSLAGRVVTRDGTVSLFDAQIPLARVPQLAIHLDREIGERGLMLDRHQHTVPVWGVNAPSFAEWLVDLVGVSSIASFDAHLYDVQKSALLGHNSDFLVSGRLDNQLSCWAAIHSLVGSRSSRTCVAILNDHEEVGSDSVTGAGGPLLESVVNTILENDRLGAGQKHDILRSSWCLSADNAHAVHPNYRERHESRHSPMPNAGVALKLNGNQRYATSARGAAHLRRVADDANVPLQTFVSRNNMPCGSTIGPITATRLGIEAIDVGVPQLSMHSAREMCGTDDPQHLLDLAAAFYES